MAKMKKINGKDITENLDQVSGGVYTPYGADKRAEERRQRYWSQPEFGVWESEGQGPEEPVQFVGSNNNQTYIPGRDNGCFGNVRG